MAPYTGARDLEVLASDKKTWVAKASKKPTWSEEQRRPRAKSDMEEPRRGQRTRSWSEVVSKDKGKDKGSEIYTRDLLLQFNCTSPSTRSTAADSDSPGSSPRSLGSAGGLFCASLEEVQRRSSEDNEAPPDGPTTAILRGIPAGYTRTAFCERLAKHGFGFDVNFLYLPKHEANEENAGIAYINLRTPDMYRSLVELFHKAKASECFPDHPSELICEVSTAEIQGQEGNFEHLCKPKNFGRWQKQGEPWQPLFLDAHGARMSLATSVQDLFKSNRPRSVSESELAATSPTASMTTPAAILQYMQMQQMQQMQQIQMQQYLQMMQKQLLLQKQAEQKAKTSELSADTPEFQPSASLRAEAEEFVPSK